MSGRGRGRGQRGRGRRHGLGRREVQNEHAHQTNVCDEIDIQRVDKNKELDIEKEPKDFFVGTVSVAQHLKGQEQNRIKYAATLAVIQKNGITVAQNARIRALVAAWIRNDFVLSEAFLENRSQFGVVEVLKSLAILDAARQIRVLEKKIIRLKMSTTNVSKMKLGKLKSDIDNLNAIKTLSGSASGALCKHIRKWVQGLTQEELEFYALHFPTESWKKLADICHFHPQKDFSSLPWFLPFCFGGPAPENSLVEKCRDVTVDNVNAMVGEYQVPYSHIKQFVKQLTSQSKERIAQYETKLDTVLWYYEDLQCMEVDNAIKHRLESGAPVTMATGKLLERLLTLKMIRENIPFDPSFSGWDVPRNKNPTQACFHPDLIPIAEKTLTEISLPLESPVVVLGDASGSMDIAVRTSTIIASLLTTITSAKLVFFNEWSRAAPYLPKTVQECLELAVTVRAEGGTSPAASLHPFYKDKEVVKTFIVVTDEEERDAFDGYTFCPLFKKYHEEVFPAKLVFVSFLREQHARGQMVEELRNAGFNPQQFLFDGNRPDLTKLDNLIGLLSSDTAFFDDEVQEMERVIKEKGLKDVFKELKDIPLDAVSDSGTSSLH